MRLDGVGHTKKAGIIQMRAVHRRLAIVAEQFAARNVEKSLYTLRA